MNNLKDRPSTPDSSDLATRDGPQAQLDWIAARIIAHPDAAPVDIRLARMLERAGHNAAAKQILIRILASTPTQADALRLAGKLAFDAKAWDEAARHLGAAATLDPEADEHSWVRWAESLDHAGKPKDAIDVCRMMAHTFPESPVGPLKTGIFLAKLDAIGDAAEQYREALRRDPRNHGALNNLANLLNRQGALDEAMRLLARAVELAPRSAVCRRNLGANLLAHGRFDAAEAEFREAMRLEPDDTASLASLGILLLMRGDFATGWPAYLARKKFYTGLGELHPAPFPDWTGDPLPAGQRLLVRGDQGLGDQILLVRLLEDLSRREIPYVMSCERRLMPLFARAFPEGRFLPADGEPNFGAPGYRDVAAASMLFELAARTYPDRDSFPAPVPYLRADPDRLRRFRERYANRGPVIGLSWRSSAPRKGTYKSCDIRELGPLLKVPGVTFVNLQYGAVAEELAAVRREFGVTVLEDRDVDATRDIDGLASLIGAMDLVVSTSSVTVHLAGALGVPTWTLLSHRAGLHWFWFLEGEGTPWYRDMRLLRQEREGDWHGVSARAAADLGAWLAKGRPRV